MKVVNVTFKFVDGQPDQKYPAMEGESVLNVALNNKLKLQHNCGGICECSTCHIYVEAGMAGLPEISDKEKNFINQAKDPKLHSRLACQCVVQGNEDLVVTIPEQDFPNHQDRENILGK
ncbi:2Fe-2S iron-sulfur cluster-binding protein [Adhaeribacter aquaticus]|uniref:2Fe-2S iron-sulfur cluster-binding protein n=1 Tax=Adhaeribacter aquaticus TaxID=299567 RepID=UPI00068888FD|nr:2Fe-2S iron-sulfur cluster-binding protein [Adhaeribacter aquaticus]